MIGQKGIPNRFGGIETHVAELATRFVSVGHDVVVYARPWYTPKTVKTYNGIHIIRLPSIATKHLDAISHTAISLAHALLVIRPDVLHIHGVGPALLAWIPKFLRPHMTVIITVHGLDRLQKKWGPFSRFMLRLGEKAAIVFADTTVVVSKNLASYFLQTYGKRTLYIPNGMTPKHACVDNAVLRPLGLSSFEYVAMVSRLIPHKNAHLLIDAWQKARTIRPDLFCGIKLAIVGDGAFTSSYVRMLKRNAKHDDSIVFTGYQSGEVLEALQGGCLFAVHPSNYEGFSISVLETMGYGKAVIVSDIPSHCEVIGDCGITFREGDVDDLAIQILSLLEDRLFTASLGHAARIRVENEFHWDEISREVLSLYEERFALRNGVLAIE